MALGWLGAGPGPARAQDAAEHGRVIEVLRQANDLGLAGQHREAISVLARARDELDDPRVDLALAESEIALGLLRRARRRLLSLRSADNPIVAEEARRRLDEVEQHLARVAVHVPPYAGALHLDVDAGGFEAALSSRVVLVLTPGAHEITLRDADGRARASGRVTARAGETQALELRPGDASPTVRRSAPGEDPSVTCAAPPAGLDPLSWVLGGSVGLVVGVVVTALAFALTP